MTNSNTTSGIEWRVRIEWPPGGWNGGWNVFGGSRVGERLANREAGGARQAGARLASVASTTTRTNQIASALGHR